MERMNGLKKTLIAIPCMDMVHTDFMISLINLERVNKTYCAVVKSSLIYDARNTLAKQAINEGFDTVLWLDSDIEFEPDMLRRLMAHIDNGKEFVSALYFKRVFPTSPVIFSKIEQIREGNELITRAIPYDNYPRNQLFEVDASGFGAVLVTVDLLKRINDKYGLPFSPALGLGEDMSFCWRAKELGAKLYCDSSIKLRHIGLTAYTEETFDSQNEEN